MTPMLQIGHPDSGREGFNFSAKFTGPFPVHPGKGSHFFPGQPGSTADCSEGWGSFHSELNNSTFLEPPTHWFCFPSSLEALSLGGSSLLRSTPPHSTLCWGPTSIQAIVL